MMFIRRCIMLLISTIILSNQAYGEKRGRYRFNHPPSIESEDTVPEAVIFNKGEARENKALKLAANFKSFPTENSLHEKELQKQDGVLMANLKSEVIPQGREKVKVREQIPLNSKENTRTDVQIPVSVVHEPDTSIKESEPNPSIKRRTLVRRRQQKPKDNIHSPVALINNTNNIKDENSGIEKKEAAFPNVFPTKTDNPLNVPIKDQTQTKSRRRMRDPVVPIVTEKNFVFAHSGNFHYSFEGGDGTKVFEEGSLKSVNNNKAGEAVFGGFSYKDKEGKDYSVTYTAGEHGYRPTGDHLPTPPPIPPAIARALAYLATKSTPQPVTEPIRYFD